MHGLWPPPNPTSSGGQRGLPRAVLSPSHPEKLSQTIPGSFIKPERIAQTPPLFWPSPQMSMLPCIIKARPYTPADE